jgi:hypothetical protein
MTSAQLVTVRDMSWLFGLLIGAMWIGEILLGNLSGTPVFGNLGQGHPEVYRVAAWFAVAAVGMTAAGGFVASHRTGSVGAALRVGVWSGLISGVMVLLTAIALVLLFHDAMMRDPSNIHEFARSAHRPPTEAELSSFVFWDSLAGGVNHVWIGPLVGMTAGGIGGLLGKPVRGA